MKSNDVVLSAVLVVAGLVNVLPVVGASGTKALRRLYGIDVAPEGAKLSLLLRHRAVLLGVVGGFMIASAWAPQLRFAGALVGLVSMLSFVAMAWTARGCGPELERVAKIDAVLSALLAWAVIFAKA